jgi:hypothetical protein
VVIVIYSACQVRSMCILAVSSLHLGIKHSLHSTVVTDSQPHVLRVSGLENREDGFFQPGKRYVASVT